MPCQRIRKSSCLFWAYFRCKKYNTDFAVRDDGAGRTNPVYDRKSYSGSESS